MASGAKQLSSRRSPCCPVGVPLLGNMSSLAHTRPGTSCVHGGFFLFHWNEFPQHEVNNRTRLAEDPLRPEGGTAAGGCGSVVLLCGQVGGPRVLACLGAGG